MDRWERDVVSGLMTCLSAAWVERSNDGGAEGEKPQVLHGAANYYRHTQGSQESFDGEHERMFQLLRPVDPGFDDRNNYVQGARRLDVDWSPELNGDTREHAVQRLSFTKPFGKEHWAKGAADTSRSGVR